MTYDGPRLFSAPIGNSAAQANFKRTVLDGVDPVVIANHTGGEPGESPVRLWGTKESVSGSWRKVSPGDYLLVYRDGVYQFAAAVQGTERNETLGKEVWPNYEEGEPWSCIIYLEEPVKLGVASAEVHDLAGYDRDHPMGFSTLNDMAIGGIRGRYGSVEAFIHGEGETTAVDITMEPTFDVPPSALEGLHFPAEYTNAKSELVDQINDALNAGKHVVFTGPPGTGKTEVARRVATHVVSANPDAYTGYEMTTATADWSTFETVGGYMPEESGDKALGFNPGQVLRCFKRRNRQRNDILIIDEINRSDIEKSFGQLFTLLSGQGVELPFTTDGNEIQIVPASESSGSAAPHEYLVPPSWRIFATMNSYDKASLYEMSYAFMRRFAFIYVDAPGIPGDENEGRRLVEGYASEWGIDAEEDLLEGVGQVWHLLNVQVDERPIGPAIVRDLLAHVASSDKPRSTAMTDALTSYVYPQLEGVRRREQVVEALARLEHVDGDRLRDVARDVLQVQFDG